MAKTKINDTNTNVDNTRLVLNTNLQTSENNLNTAIKHLILQ